MDKILMYHAIGEQGVDETGAGRYTVSREAFRRQMEYLSLHRDKDFLITFDDGHLSNYQYAYPVLKELGLRAYFFVIVSRIGRPGFMDWDHLRELDQQGMIIGSHGMTHRILTELDEQQLDYELSASKSFLQKRLGQWIDFLSIPRGAYNQRVIDQAARADYKVIFTSNLISSRDNFALGRIPIKRDWSQEYFIDVLEHGLSFNDRCKELVKDWAKKMLGMSNYDMLRTAILKQ
ncbi:MAG: polysaccharide deacetylase family protein [Candidatus Omnitrophota bacterium]